MKNQVKVSTTQQHSDSQGEHVVHKGKLVLIDVRDKDNLSDIAVVGKEMKEPIIISETEEIEVEDWVYYYTTKEVEIAKSDQDINTDSCKKVLALPEHFSDKHLQAIVDGKMKDGDGVLVKCISKYSAHTMTNYDISLGKRNIGIVHLDQQNHITLYPIQQSLEEAAEKYNEEYYQGSSIEESFIAGAEWAKKNNY